MIWDTNKKELDLMHDRILNLTSKIEALQLARPDHMTKEQEARLADLEVKMVKLWGLLVTSTPNGQDKLTKHGRLFGSKIT